MYPLLAGDGRQPTADRVLWQPNIERGKGERRRFLAASEDLQQFRESLGRRVGKLQRFRRRRGWDRACQSETNLAVVLGHGGAPLGRIVFRQTPPIYDPPRLCDRGPFWAPPALLPGVFEDHSVRE